VITHTLNLQNPTMRRFTLIWLIFSLLGYSMVLAADLHHMDHKSDAGVALHLDKAGNTHHGDKPNAPIPDCDHCCHGTAHLLGLGRSLPHQPRLPRSAVRVAIIDTTLCTLPSLPFRPPIAS